MSELPEGWVWTQLDDITINHDGKRVPVRLSDRESMQGSYPYYGASGIIDSVNDYLFDGEYLLIAEDGANLLSRSTPIAFRAAGRFWVNNHAHVLTTMQDIPQKYVEYYINSLDLSPYVTGTAQPKLTQRNMNRIPVPLAPLAEQKRIADKLDALLARVDGCRARLARMPAILKRFRQAVLAAATSGVLTADWREAPVDMWEDHLLGELLQGKPRNGYSPKPVDYETSVRSLTLSATTTGTFKPEHYKYIDVNIPKDSHLWLQPGDILIQRANTIEYVGVSAVYDGPPYGFIYSDLMMKCRATPKVLTKFLHYTLLSENTRAFLRSKATGTAGNMPKINQPTVMSVPVKVPSLAEQHEIVRRVETLFGYADRLEAHYRAAQARVDGLTPALLAKAFRGELVAQDPADEPATVLLERVQPNLTAAAQRPTRGPQH